VIYYDNSAFELSVARLFQHIQRNAGEKTLLNAMKLAAAIGLEAAYRYVKTKRFKHESVAEQYKLKQFLCTADEHRREFAISYKFNHLCDVIRELHERHGEEFCGIIFVEERAKCRMLCNLLKDVDIGEGIHLGFFHGQGKTTCTAVRYEISLFGN